MAGWKLPARIAWRYIFSKKSTNAINVIAGVSMFGIAVGAAALIIVLSAFNGFEDLVRKLYASFYPDIEISIAEGKVFETTSLDMEAILTLDGVEAVSQVLEENAIVVYGEEEHIAIFKGVDQSFADVTAVDDSVLYGRYQLEWYIRDSIRMDGAVLGAGVAGVLDILLGPNAQPLDVYMPRRGRSIGIGGSRAFKRKRIVPTGVFRIQQEFDAQYVLVPLSFMQELLEYRAGEISALELKLKPGASSARVIRDLEAILGEDFLVRNRYQINETVYRVMRTEKWAVYFVLTFILIVAAFNTIGSLSMLVLDKKKDIGTLRSLGGGRSLVQRVFLLEGLLQTGLSMTIGFVFALALLIGQIVFHWVKIPGAGTFVVDAYPVKMELLDFVLVFVTILVIGTLAAWIPARRAAASRFTITSAK